MEQDEPYNDFLEEVSIGTRFKHWNADVVVTFDSRTGVFSAEKGCIVETTEIGEGQGKVTKISVESDGGNRYIVIRKRGGVYKAKSWLTWVSVKKTQIN